MIYSISPPSSTSNCWPTPKSTSLNFDYRMPIINIRARSSMASQRRRDGMGQHSRQGIESSSDEKSIHQGSQGSKYLLSMSNRLLDKIQLLGYEKTPPHTLESEFKRILRSHIGWDDIFPVGKSDIGKQLIKDGLFHEMWRKVCEKNNNLDIYGRYYSMFYSQLKRNHTNFEKAYNHNDSLQETSNPKKIVNEDSTTRLTMIKKQKKEVVQQKSVSLHYSSKENASIDDFNLSLDKYEGRLKLYGKIQTNERRLNAELVCYFMGLKKCYDLVEIQIDKILEFYHHQSKELLILQAYEPSFCEEVGRIVVKCQPKILMSMYGYVSFSQLLRIKQQYTKIDGFIIYDELLKLNLWLQNNGFLTPDS